MMNIQITISRDDLYLVNDAKINYLYGPPFHEIKKDVSEEEEAFIEDFDENDEDYQTLLRETYRRVTWFDRENERPQREPVFVTFSIPKRAAEAGDADCQYAMGQVLISDKDRAKKKESVPWFERAAQQNHPEAQRTLGIFCSTGRYLPKDDEKAAEWFQKAADRDDPIAQLLLGKALREGIGVAKDETKAFSYFLKSARAGNAEAQFNTAVCYLNGIGTKRDAEKAECYLHLSAQQDFAPAIQLMKKVGIPWNP